jgi:cytochrome c biogenesis protein CcmG, thiol:disulfide interchange protein DsbE
VPVAAAGVVVAAVVSSAGGTPDRPPFAAARGFTLPPVVAGQPSAGLAGKPGRPVVLTFFAAWCAPCVTELPLIERLSETWQREGSQAPVVVGVDELDQRPDGPDLVRRTGVTFPSGFDHDGSVGRQWLLDGLPVTVFIAPDGRVVAYHRGQLDQATLDGLVRRLTAAAR